MNYYQVIALLIYFTTFSAGLECYPNNLCSGIGKKVKSQSYVRATNAGEYIEVERTHINGERCYKIQVLLEAFNVPQVISFSIKDHSNAAKLDVRLKNILLDGLHRVRISGTAASGASKHAKIHFDIPKKILLESEFSATGVVGGKRLCGEGTLCLKIRSTLITSMVEMCDNGRDMQIEDLMLNYDFNHLEININHVEIDGLSRKQTADVLHNIIACYLKGNSEKIGKYIANDIRYKINKKLLGISATKIISENSNVC